jgi:hypothetical protein
MISFINILILFIIIILFFIPASNKRNLSNISLGASFLLFIVSLFLLSIPMSSAIYVKSGVINIINFPYFVINYSYMLDNILFFI